MFEINTLVMIFVSHIIATFGVDIGVMNPSVGTQSTMRSEVELELNESTTGVQLVVYDFDQTISCLHVFLLLQKLAKIRGSHGQTLALNALNDSDVSEIFGGAKRLARLHDHFNQITKYSNAKIMILSNGYENVIKTSLQMVQLLQYFRSSDIIGRDTSEFKESLSFGGKSFCIDEIKEKLNLTSSNVCLALCVSYCSFFALYNLELLQ